MKPEPRSVRISVVVLCFIAQMTFFCLAQFFGARSAWKTMPDDDDSNNSWVN